ncbi:UDP-2,3-diacylglucosamine diphosphatase [Cupriavidus pinatubonensis]|uniref:UDP-2,3-diacylglucosamine diphosphatase n=1 Tax=Cupriavidus pinatubonensis TaxID=248026 RepID=UPI001128655F|nr:UDP-2,3-diacylglucosamine diphosphatase [Cupriavidus pinatubonensis]TPQ43484.1 UDP-2,3-diacylglucosamine diphosphatase [Cupriavidus pinatubonensis]
MTAIPTTPVAGPLEVQAPAWFISDLHLTPGMPRTLAAFERVLERAAMEARTLFILGDFFEFWVGDEETSSPFAARVATALRTLAGRGVPVYLMHGNRDFLLGKRFAKAAGATLLPDPTVILCAGQRVVLSHGDMLCTDDERYNRFRRWTRKRWVQRVFLALPLSARLGVARRLRADSEAGRQRQIDQGQPTHVVYGDTSPAAVTALLEASDARLLVHGHTHRPARHQDAAGVRWVLTDWDLDGSQPRAAVLQLDEGGFHVLPQTT